MKTSEDCARFEYVGLRKALNELVNRFLLFNVRDFSGLEIYSTNLRVSCTSTTKYSREAATSHDRSMINYRLRAR